MSRNIRVWSLVGLALSVSCWISAPMMLGFALGEKFSSDPAEMERMYHTRQIAASSMMAAFLFALCGASALAGVTFRQHKVAAMATWAICGSLCLVIVGASFWR